MSSLNIGQPLPDDLLARRATLPLKPEAVELAGRHVRLTPLDLDAHIEALFAVSDGRPVRLGEREVEAYDADDLIWRYMPGGPFAGADDLTAYLRLTAEGPDSTTFVALDQATDAPVGVISYLANSPAHLKVELGGIWYSPVVQRTAANTEATYLLLRHAFDLGYRRLEWKCDTLNVRSRRAAERMGFRFEGIQEAHYIVKGRNRDTAWFRILAEEWPEVRAHLERLITR